ncbi:MAG: hypothetical protein HGB11_09470 [Chlorobiales bacterium]|nr:hypothetical protein [Chlorobiales bacterium]
MVSVIKDYFVLIRPSGSFNAHDLNTLRKDMMKLDEEKPHLTKRFSDFTDVSELNVSFNDFSYYKNNRLYLNDVPKYRTAFYVESELKFGYARMCQTIIEDPKNEIRVFRDKQEAANWLKIDRADIPD